MPEKTYTLAEAAKEKGVSRQAIHLFVLRHKDRCTREYLPGTKLSAWFIPASLLSEYTPVEVRQAAGQARARSVQK